MIDIDKVLGDKEQSRALLGIDKAEFEYMLSVYEQVLKDQDPYYAGRSHTLKTAKDKQFFILYYLKSYDTYDVLAAQYGTKRPRAFNWVKENLPILSETLRRLNLLPSRKINDREHFKQIFPTTKDIFTDVTERPVHRPKNSKQQRKHYSGKQKDHTKKRCDLQRV